MRRASVVATLFALTGLATTLTATQPAVAASGAATIGTIPAGDRYEPRAATVLGSNATGFVYQQETDQGFDGPGGGYVAMWHSFSGGSDQRLGNESGTVVGNHLVRLNTSESPNTVTDTSLPTGTATDVSVPGGDTVVSATADGVVVASQSLAIGLLPWGSSSVAPISGLPASPIQANVVTGPTTMTAHGALLQVALSTGGLALYYVDTTALRAWPLTTQTAYGAAIGSSAITWIQPSSDGTSEQVASVAIPQPGDVAAATPTLRNASLLNSQSPNQWTTLALGTNVLFWQVLAPQQYARENASPLYAVAGDGTTTTISTWAHGVQPMADGQHALLITGNTPTSEQVSELAAGGATMTQVQTIAPIIGRTGQLAVDGSRVVQINDSAPNGAVVENTVSAANGALTVGADQQIATGAEQVAPNNCSSEMCTSLVADNGSTGYVDPDNLHLVTYSGTTKVADTALNGRDGGLRGTDGQHVLLSNSNAVYDSLYDIATGTEALTTLMKPTLAAGYLYGFAPNTQETAITALNLQTSASTSIPLPTGCAFADLTPQAAGPYVLLKCGSSATGPLDTWAVVNRLDSSQIWVDKLTAATLGQWWLGDGFVVGSDASGNLEWSALSDATHSWQPLGAWGGVPGTLAVALSGAQATVAWADSNELTHVAVLPITETATTDATALTTSPAATITAGATMTISATLTDTTSSTGLPGQSVDLLQRTSPTAKFGLGATVGTGAGGSVAVHIKPTQTTQYAWYFAGATTLSGSFSGITTVSVAQQVSAATTHSSVRPGKPIVIYGVTSPAQAGQRVVLQLKRQGRWSTLSESVPTKTQTLPNRAHVLGYVITTKEPKKGAYTFRVMVATSRKYAASASRPVTVEVAG